MSKLLRSCLCRQLLGKHVVSVKSSTTEFKFGGDKSSDKCQIRLLSGIVDTHHDIEKLISRVRSKNQNGRLSDSEVKVVKAFFENISNSPSSVPVKLIGETAKEKLANMDEKQKLTFKMIQEEFNYMKSAYFEVPFEMNDNIWVELLECKDFLARKKVINAHFEIQYRQVKKQVRMYWKNMDTVNQMPVSVPQHPVSEPETPLEHYKMSPITVADDSLECKPLYNNHDRKIHDPGPKASLNQHRSNDKQESSSTEKPYAFKGSVYSFSWKKSRSKWFENKYLNTKMYGIPLIFDFDIKKEDNVQNLLQESLHVNYEQLQEPFDVTICNVSAENVAKYTRLDDVESAYFHSGVGNLAPDMFSMKHYSELHDPADLVYITGTTNKVVNDFKFDPTKVYIIGNRTKTDIINETNRIGIPRIKFPIAYQFREIGVTNSHYLRRRRASRDIDVDYKRDDNSKRGWELNIFKTLLILDLLRRGQSWREIVAYVFPRQYQCLSF